MYKHTAIQTHRQTHTDTQTHRHTDTLLPQLGAALELDAAPAALVVPADFHSCSCTKSLLRQVAALELDAAPAALVVPADFHSCSCTKSLAKSLAVQSIPPLHQFATRAVLYRVALLFVWAATSTTCASETCRQVCDDLMKDVGSPDPGEATTEVVQHLSNGLQALSSVRSH